MVLVKKSTHQERSPVLLSSLSEPTGLIEDSGEKFHHPNDGSVHSASKEQGPADDTGVFPPCNPLHWLCASTFALAVWGLPDRNWLHGWGVDSHHCNHAEICRKHCSVSSQEHIQKTIQKHIHIQKHNSFGLLFVLSSPDEAPNPTNCAFSNCNFNNFIFRKDFWWRKLWKAVRCYFSTWIEDFHVIKYCWVQCNCFNRPISLTHQLKKEVSLKYWLQSQKSLKLFICPFCWKQKTVSLLFRGKRYFIVHF